MGQDGQGVGRGGSLDLQQVGYEVFVKIDEAAAHTFEHFLEVDAAAAHIAQHYGVGFAAGHTLAHIRYGFLLCGETHHVGSGQTLARMGGTECYLAGSVTDIY